MITKKFSRSLLAFMVGFSLSCSPIQGASANNMPMEQIPTDKNAGAPQLSLEDLQAMEQFVEAERAKMTDEQRAQFDQDVMALTKEFEKMQQENPEQFNAFIDQMLFGQAPAEEALSQAAAPAEQPEVTPAQIQPQEEAPKTNPNLEAQEKTIQAINAIIKHTSSFLNKTATMVEFPGKLKKWADQGKIRGWIPGYTWESDKNKVGIKEHIEKLVQKLSSVKEQDRATKTYKHIDKILANKDLVKNLEDFARKLKELEPQIEVDEFGLDPVSKDVRAIMRSVLAEYINALFARGIPQDLDTVINAFETTAKKYRDEEEGLTKQAIEASKKARPARGTVVSGYPEESGSYGYGNANSGLNSYDYFPYNNQSYQPSSFDSTPEQKVQDKKDGQLPEEKKNSGSEKSSDSDKKGGKEEETKDTPEDKKIRDGIKQLESNMAEISQTIESIVDRPEQAKISADDLGNAIKKSKQATRNLNSLKIKIKKASTDKKKSRFKEEIRESLELHSETLSNAKKISGPTDQEKKTPAPVVDVEVKVPEVSTAQKEAFEALAEKQVIEESKEEILTDQQRNAKIKQRTEELAKKYTQSAFEQEKARVKQVRESQKEEEIPSYSVQDLANAIEEVQKAFKGF